MVLYWLCQLVSSRSTTGQG